MNHHSSSHLLLLISVVFGAVWVAHAQVPFPGKCPDVKLLDTFDAEAYMGVWYEYAAYPFAFEIGKKCIYANYSLIDNSTVSVVNAAINRFTGQPSNVTGQAKVLGPGQLAVAFYPTQPLTKANYLVLGTDYESYAVVYSCTSVTPLANFKIVWILTRQREPSAEAVDAARKILEDNDVSQAFLIDTVQKNCPRLDGNGTGLAGEDGLDVDDFVSTTVPNAIEKA
nr:neural lazarillo, isoform C [Drosophila melanogaster]NP_787960.1 neural lazarillo, isoform A [Drosophila melanogaster]ACL91655.1 NLaz-PA [synthetic construct]AAF51378.2 neural lazarillo, isoform A [Drosophila melanogaster]AAL89923.1 RE67583p [Drosophila melanogaster]AHN54075.1 neural lazarillo, isoform C [Drosophila melanogaster]|eukprot:NP_001285560.1 neural lazarillo, isoform C [Drosophila melanogaster]